MPPTLDLSMASHTRSVISPPRINLRRAASYNHDRGPLSSTSSRFNFNHLVFSPPPSPGLPSLSPPMKKPSRRVFGGIRPIRAIRYAIRLLSVFVVFFVALEVLTWLFGEPVPAPKRPGQPAGAAAGDTTSQRELPDFPTPIVVTDHRGRAKWTVSIPPGSGFPLTMKQYADMCVRCGEVAEQTRSQGHGLYQFSLGFGSDATSDFVDVQEAEKAGYLHRWGVGSGESASGASGSGKPACKKSLTFVLETDDAGLGKTLMMLWIAYGLAAEEGRAFFVDDTRWAYGEYSAIFQPPPQPDCSPPPSHEILPCPRHARHLVASAANADLLFASLTRDGSSSSGAHERTLLRSQFDLARQGYEALFRLIKEDADYVDARARELMAKRIVPRSRGPRNGLAVGVHIRRGDRHPLEPQYRHSYMPLHLYSDAAREAIEARLGASAGSDGSGEGATAMERSILVLASDDPTVYESAELTVGSGGGGGSSSSRAQERILLAGKHATPRAAPDRSVLRKFVDEAFGWEGGFFAAMFWNLGVSTVNAAGSLASAAGDGSGSGSGSGSGGPEPSAETLRLRSLVGRAYMLDLAVLAEASDVVVCTVSAVGCRLLAVMMGWQSAMEEANWVNIDGGYGWLGLE